MARLFTGEHKNDEYKGFFNESRFKRDSLIVFAYIASTLTAPFWLQKFSESTRDIWNITIAMSGVGIGLILLLATYTALSGYDTKRK